MPVDRARGLHPLPTLWPLRRAPRQPEIPRHLWRDIGLDRLAETPRRR